MSGVSGDGGGGLRILVVSNMWPTARSPAFGIFVARRVEAYRRLGTEVSVAAIGEPRSGPIRTPLKYGILALRALAAALRRRPDVVESHYLVPTAVIARIVAGLVRRPYVLVAHGTDVLTDHAPAMMRPIRAAVRNAAAVHVNSTATADAVRKRFGREPEIIPPGVDLAAFDGPRESGGPDGTVVFVGALEHHKGVDLLLAAAAGSKRPWQVVLVGDGSSRSEYEATVERSGLADRTRFAGRVSPERLPGILRQADVLVLPSRREALGLAAVEALAAGTPVVVSDLEGPASIPDATCGSVVPAGDVAALRAAVESWIDRAGDPVVAGAARNRARRFDADHLAAEALESLHRASSGGR